MTSGPTNLSEREERFGEIAFAYLRETKRDAQQGKSGSSNPQRKK